MSGRLSVAPVLSIGPIREGDGRGGRNLMIPISPILLSRLFLFFFSGYLYIYIYSQISIFVIKSAKIMCFLRFSIARIRPNFKKNCQISTYGLSKVAQNIEVCFKILLSYLVCS